SGRKASVAPLCGRRRRCPGPGPRTRRGSAPLQGAYRKLRTASCSTLVILGEALPLLPLQEQLEEGGEADQDLAGLLLVQGAAVAGAEEGARLLDQGSAVGEGLSA